MAATASYFLAIALYTYLNLLLAAYTVAFPHLLQHFEDQEAVQSLAEEVTHLVVGSNLEAGIASFDLEHKQAVAY